MHMQLSCMPGHTRRTHLGHTCSRKWLSSGAALRSVMFNFLGRDFFNALAEKDADRFYGMIVKWLCALCVGIPVFVFRDYYQARGWRRCTAVLTSCMGSRSAASPVQGRT